MKEYVLLYPFYSSNALQPTIDIQNRYEVTQFEDSPTGATDETSDGADEVDGADGADGSYEEGDGDEDVGEESGSDFWQSVIDYFGICEGKNKIKATRLSIKGN